MYIRIFHSIETNEKKKPRTNKNANKNEDGKTLPAGIREQTIICMNKVKELCAAADLTLDNVVDCTVLLGEAFFFWMSVCVFDESGVCVDGMG